MTDDMIAADALRHLTEAHAHAVHDALLATLAAGLWYGGLFIAAAFVVRSAVVASR